MIDPPDGRIPAYTPEAAAKRAAAAQRRREHPADGPWSRGLGRAQHETGAVRVRRRPQLQHEVGAESCGSGSRQRSHELRDLLLLAAPGDQVCRLGAHQPRGSGILPLRRLAVDEQVRQPTVDVQNTALRERVAGALLPTAAVEKNFRHRSLWLPCARRCTSSDAKSTRDSPVQGFRRRASRDLRPQRCGPCLQVANQSRQPEVWS